MRGLSYSRGCERLCSKAGESPDTSGQLASILTSTPLQLLPPAGDRVVVTLNGKFLPYKKY
jgi:hypothetical protein